MIKSDIKISQENKMENILEIAKKSGIDLKYIEQYGNYKAKVDTSILNENTNKDGKLILVTAINPTPSGEGKTTVTIGLSDGLKKIGKNIMVALREPSLGPVFGLKGGATGGGYAQVVPMEDINLHFTGDFHAISAANNLLSAMLDNHIHQGNELNIDTRKIVWKRCVDMNDRQLRNIVNGLGGKVNGVPREDGYDITVASEIMAILCLANSIKDLKKRLSKIIVAYTYDDKPITANDLKATGAMAVLLKDAIKPNLVQTLEKTPAFIHGGPFANIAHGCNSIIATKMAMKLADYTVTEAGFGADLGAEKFLDIKCRYGNIKPNCVVIVATVRALKMHGGLEKNNLTNENIQALEKGIENLLRHIKNIKKIYNLPVVVSINKFITDTENEINFIIDECKNLEVKAVLTNVWAEGSDGAINLAEEVVKICDEESDFSFSYNLEDSIEDKIKSVVTKIYGGSDVNFSQKAKTEIEKINNLGFGELPICIAKTQYSFSDNNSLLGAPKGFTINVKEVKVSAGAGFIVVLTGDIMTMPGLPKIPSAEKIDISDDGVITGLF